MSNEIFSNNKAKLARKRILETLTKTDLTVSIMN